MLSPSILVKELAPPDRFSREGLHERYLRAKVTPTLLSLAESDIKEAYQRREALGPNLSLALEEHEQLSYAIGFLSGTILQIEHLITNRR